MGRLLFSFAFVSAFSFAQPTVPIPDFGTLKVVGTLGAGQTDIVFVSYCEAGAESRYVRGSCKETKLRLTLNKAQRVPASNSIRLDWNRTQTTVAVKAGEETVVELARLIIPKSEFNFQVFHDYTAASEVTHFNEDFWGHFDDGLVRSFCSVNNPDQKAVCEAADTDPATLMGLVFKFTATATKSGLRAWLVDGKSDWIQMGRSYVNDSVSSKKHDTFVSVFPGVYGVEFEDPETGVVTDCYGMNVEAK